MPQVDVHLVNWQVRIVASHDASQDYHEWITLGERLRADCTGRLNPRISTVEWQRWICNNPECPAEARVPDDAIAQLIEQAFPVILGRST